MHHQQLIASLLPPPRMAACCELLTFDLKSELLIVVKHVTLLNSSPRDGLQRPLMFMRAQRPGDIENRPREIAQRFHWGRPQPPGPPSPGEHFLPVSVRATTKNVDEVARRPIGPRPVPQALSNPIISFKPQTRGWLHEAISGLVGQEAIEDTGDYRIRSWEVEQKRSWAEARHPGPISPRNLISAMAPARNRPGRSPDDALGQRQTPSSIK